MQAQTQLPDETQTRMPGRFKPVAELIGAFRFLTRLPVPFARTISPVPLLQCMRLFPLVGAVIGVVQGIALYAAFYMGVPALLSACLSVTLVVMITGALHEDGLADTADGFGGGKDREQRLLIMRDSRIGTYGTVALILAFMIRVTALEALLNQPLAIILCMCAAAGSFSRAMMVDLLWASRPARSDGLSVYAGRPSRGTTLFAIFSGGILPLVCSFLLVPQSGILALAAATLATAAIRMMAMRMIGGQTGDVCGAVQVCSEIAILCVFAATN
jgi:adenosylcobinamide-GDP ribazoletransferase